MTMDRIIATITLNTAVSFDASVASAIPFG
jgi:hypothetical protein